MAKIPVSVVRELLSHASPNAPASLRAWTHPPTFGESVGAYNVLARLAAAGITPEALYSAGLCLQSEGYGAARRCTAGADKPLDDGEGRRARYKSAGHTRGVEYAVSKESCPSGLRPVLVRAGWSAGQLAAWHASLQQAVATATGDTIEVPPVVSGDGTALGAPRSPQSPRSPRASGPFGRFMDLRTLLGGVITDMVGILEGADDPEATRPAVQALTTWALAAPVSTLDGVTADAFDTTTIRQGSPVVFVDGSPALRVAGFKLKAAKIAEMPLPWRVQSIAEGVATLDHGVTAKLADLRRYVAPKPVEATPAAAWKPTADALATYDGAECLVEGISADGEVASIITAEGETIMVAVESLTAPQA